MVSWSGMGWYGPAGANGANAVGLDTGKQLGANLQHALLAARDFSQARAQLRAGLNTLRRGLYRHARVEGDTSDSPNTLPLDPDDTVLLAGFVYSWFSALRAMGDLAQAVFPIHLHAAFPFFQPPSGKDEMAGSSRSNPSTPSANVATAAQAFWATDVSSQQLLQTPISPPAMSPAAPEPPLLETVDEDGEDVDADDSFVDQGESAADADAAAADNSGANAFELGAIAGPPKTNAACAVKISAI